MVHTHRLDQLSGQCTPEYRPGGGAEGNYGKQPISHIHGIHIIRECPELGNHHQIENTHPEIENDPERYIYLRQYIKRDQTGHKEQRHQIDQQPPWKPRRKNTVKRYGAQQQQSLSRGSIALDLSASAYQNQGFSNRLQDIVSSQQSEDIESQQETRGTFAWFDFGKKSKQSLNGILLLVIHWFLLHRQI